MTLLVRLDREMDAWRFFAFGSEQEACSIMGLALQGHPAASRLEWSGGLVLARDLDAMLDAVNALFERCDELRVHVLDHMEEKSEPIGRARWRGE